MGKQIALGNKAENDLAKIFKDNGYWAHIFAKARDGSQPFDVIAVRGDCVWMLDSKHIRKQEASFPFSDIQPNQIVSMDYAIRFANVNSGRVGFVIFFERDEHSPRFFPYTLYCQMANQGKKSVNLSGLQPFKEALLMR